MNLFQIARIFRIKYATEETVELVNHDENQRLALINKLSPLVEHIVAMTDIGVFTNAVFAMKNPKTNYSEDAISARDSLTQILGLANKLGVELKELFVEDIIKFFDKILSIITLEESKAGISVWGERRNSFLNIFKLFEDHYTAKTSWGDKSLVNQLERKAIIKDFSDITKCLESIQRNILEGFKIFKKMNFISEIPEVTKAKKVVIDLTDGEKTKIIRDFYDELRLPVVNSLFYWKKYFEVPLEDQIANNFSDTTSYDLMKEVFHARMRQPGGYKQGLLSSLAKSKLNEVAERIQRMKKRDEEKEFIQQQKQNPLFHESEKPMLPPIRMTRSLKDMMNDPPNPSDEDAKVYYEGIGPSEIAKMDSDERKEFIKNKNEYIRLKNRSLEDKRKDKEGFDSFKNELEQYSDKVEL